MSKLGATRFAVCILPIIIVEFGMEFKRTFNRKDEPFTVEKKWASMLLRNYAETFEKVKETEKEVADKSETSVPSVKK